MTIKCRELWLITGLTLLTAILRLSDLTGRSMWLDEGFTLTRLAGSWEYNLRNIVILQGIWTTDLHPPFFFLILKGWGELLGHSEYVLKLIPAAAAILLVPATYVLGRRLFDSQVGLLAAVLAFLSPAYQWHGHELRMYTLVPLLAALTNYGIYRALQPRRIALKRWAAWWVLSGVALFTHYSLAGLFGAQLLFTILIFISHRPRLSKRDMARLLAILAVLGVAAVATGATADVVYRVNQVSRGLLRNAGAMEPLNNIISNIINSTLFGMNATDPTGNVFTWFVAGLTGVGLLLSVRLSASKQASGNWLTGSARPRVFLAIAIACPILFVFFLAFAFANRPSFRYSITVVPALHVLWAYLFVAAWHIMSPRLRPLVGTSARLARLPRVAMAAISMAGVVGIVVAQLFGLVLTFVRSPNWEDDWRGTAQYIRNQWQAGDVLLINLLTPQDIVVQYLGDLPIDVVPMVKFHDAQEVKQFLESNYRRVWYANTGHVELPSYDPLVGALLSYHQHERIPFPSKTTIIDLRLFDIHSPLRDRLPPEAQAVDEGVTSGSAGIAAYEIGAANPYHLHPNMRLSLYWRKTGSSVDAHDYTDYSVSVRLKSEDQRVWADWFMPAALEQAPAEWAEANFFRADYVVPLPIGLPPQGYHLELVVGRGNKADAVQTFQRLVSDEQLQRVIRITRWPPSAADAPAMLWRSTGAGIESAEYPTVVHPGEILPVVLTWRLDQPEAASWLTILSFQDLLGREIVSTPDDTGSAEPPATSWPLNEPVRDMRSLQLPYRLQPGWYRLSLSRKSADGRVADGALLGMVEVRDYPPQPVAVHIPQPVNAQVGEISMLGYGLYQPLTRTALLEFHTYWRVEAQPERDGVLFLHLIGPTPLYVAQDDSVPEQGKRSTLTFRPGDGIDQVHRLIIPAEWPGGEYRLYAGIYDRDGGLRWPVEQDGKPARDDLVYLGTIQLPDLFEHYTYVPVVVSTSK